jgi:hypothetical protein
MKICPQTVPKYAKTIKSQSPSIPVPSAMPTRRKKRKEKKKNQQACKYPALATELFDCLSWVVRQ